MGEVIAGGRVVALAMIAEGMEDVRNLTSSINNLKDLILSTTGERDRLVARYNGTIEQITIDLELHEANLSEIAGRLDRTFFEMYQSTPAGGIVPEKVRTPRAKKGAAPVIEPVEKSKEKLVECPHHNKEDGTCSDETGACPAEFPGSCKGREMCTDLAPKDQLDEETEERQAEEADAVETTEGLRVAFHPLAVTIGNCELCGGLGVIDGTLYGEFALVPCNCEAGHAVQDPDQGAPISVCDNAGCEFFSMDDAGGCSVPAEDRAGHPLSDCPNYQAVKTVESENTLLKCCEDCTIENPDCATCNLPDMETPFQVEEPELPECFNKSCTAAGPGAKDVCLRIGTLGRAPQECKNTVTAAPSAESAGHDRGAAVEPAKTEALTLTDLQLNCPHPRPFRETVEGVGVKCKVCLLVIEPIESPAVEVIKPEQVDQAKSPDCCKPSRRRWESDTETGEAAMYCMDCRTIHGRRDKAGKALPL